MNLEILRILRNVLLRSFLIGIIVTAVLAAITILGWQNWMSMATVLLHTDRTVITPIIVQFFTDIRFYLLMVLLVPGLAIHWTLKCESKSMCKTSTKENTAQCLTTR